MSTIDRVRYYDGEFLRAFDFSDEQTYHMEMRRRLNRYLHLFGIVQGLNLVSPSGSTDVSIMPGLAIDAFGREIYVFAPYTLGDSDVTANRITKAGIYDVWLRYQKTPSTPPSSGYGDCNQANQYTRWVESFSVALLGSPSNPFPYPKFADDDTDDPSGDHVGVLLGTVSIDPISATATFSAPKFDRRCKLLGVIAQRINTPPDSDTAQVSSQLQPFNFWNQPSGGLNTSLSPPASLEIEPNIFAEKNLILGPDFNLAQTAGGVAITPKPKFVTGPGSAKLAGDLIVQGNIYSFLADPVNPQWLGLSAYVQQLVQQGLPDISTGSLPVSIPATGTFAGGAFTGSAQVPVTMNRLKSFGSQQVIVSFSQIETTSQADLSALFTLGTQMQLKLIGVPQFAFSGATTSGNVGVSWQAQPASGGSPGKCAIDNFTVTCWVILFP